MVSDQPRRCRGFFDGAYHYFASDMMGCNAIGDGDPRKLPVASVHQIKRDGGIIRKMKAPRDVDAKLVGHPMVAGGCAGSSD